MSGPVSTGVLRRRPLLARILGPIVAWLLPPVFALLRRVWPIAHLGRTYVVTRHDDVREVFARDDVFAVTYAPRLDLLMSGQPFILGMADGPAYAEAIAALRGVMRADDLPELARRVERQAGSIVADAGGRIEVVDALVRQVTFDVLTDYLGVPAPAEGDLRVWATRLFEYQFFGGDAALLAEVHAMAPALRRHIAGAIERRRAVPDARDDVLARCLARQAGGDPWFSDDAIRTSLAGMIIGGPPQPPMVVPQALEQLLRRPEALAGAAAAARAGDDDRLWGHVIEAMRFDPVGPGVPRVVLRDAVIADGTPRRTRIPVGATVIAAFQSAMMDERRVPDPARFDPRRPAEAYIHFGHGMHECFGRFINRATLHLMLKPLLARPNLRRAPGPAGHLRKSGPFAEALTVDFDR